MNNWLLSLRKRTNKEFETVEGSFIKAFNVIFPIFIYYTVDIVLIRLGAIAVKLLAGNYSKSAGLMSSQGDVFAAVIKLIAVIGAAIAVSYIFEREKPVIIHKDSPISWYIVSAVLGVSGALFFNLLFSVTGIAGMSDSYSQVAEHQYSIGLGLGIIVYGLVTPLTEEIVFRGIVYNRMRRYYGLAIALILNPLIFGLYHGNLVQAAYGTVLGFLITWTYERFGSFIIPYIIHASANLIVYICVSTNILAAGNMYFGCIITGVIMIIAFLFIARAIDQKK